MQSPLRDSGTDEALQSAYFGPSTGQIFNDFSDQTFPGTSVAERIEIFSYQIAKVIGEAYLSCSEDSAKDHFRSNVTSAVNEIYSLNCTNLRSLVFSSRQPPNSENSWPFFIKLIVDHFLKDSVSLGHETFKLVINGVKAYLIHESAFSESEELTKTANKAWSLFSPEFSHRIVGNFYQDAIDKLIPTVYIPHDLDQKSFFSDYHFQNRLERLVEAGPIFSQLNQQCQSADDYISRDNLGNRGIIGIAEKDRIAFVRDLLASQADGLSRFISGGFLPGCSFESLHVRSETITSALKKLSEPKF